MMVLMQPAELIIILRRHRNRPVANPLHILMAIGKGIGELADRPSRSKGI